MEIDKSDIVVSIAGRDEGHYFMILELETGYAIMADGRIRKAEKPKRKKLKHVRFAAKSGSRAAQKIKDGEKVTNNELRRALSEFLKISDE